MSEFSLLTVRVHFFIVRISTSAWDNIKCHKGEMLYKFRSVVRTMSRFIHIKDLVLLFRVLDSNGRQNPCSDGALSWGWDGEEVGCIKESAKENERWAVRFILHREEADWLEEDRQWDHWTRVMMSALSLRVWESGSNVKNRRAAKHLESRQMRWGVPYWTHTWA